MRTSQVGARSTHQFFAFYIVGGGLYLVVTAFSGGAFEFCRTAVSDGEFSPPADWSTDPMDIAFLDRYDREASWPRCR